MKKTLMLSIFLYCLTPVFSQTISTFPYTQDFEAEATCSTGCGAVCNTLLTWSNPTTDDLDWLVDVGGTGSSATGPSVDHTLGSASGKYVYVETSCDGTGYSYKRADLVSPYFNITALPLAGVEFWYHAYGTTQGVLNVEAKIGMQGTFVNIGGPYQDDLDEWQKVELMFVGSIYEGQDSVQVRFVYVSGTSFGGDIALDDISIKSIVPLVPVPLANWPIWVGIAAIGGILVFRYRRKIVGL
ncbi:MAG: hypothetical protein HQ521_09960 [Bacteroidetes bacterium]|nr:hypothetical protein [Bacteroidota bacterium]